MKRFSRFALLLLLPLALAGCPKKSQPTAQDFTEAKAHFERACSACHRTDMVMEKRKSPAEWADAVKLMVSRGAALTPEQAAQVVDYLSAVRAR